MNNIVMTPNIKVILAYFLVYSLIQAYYNIVLKEIIYFFVDFRKFETILIVIGFLLVTLMFWMTMFAL